MSHKVKLVPTGMIPNISGYIQVDSDNKAIKVVTKNLPGIEVIPLGGEEEVKYQVWLELNIAGIVKFICAGNLENSLDKAHILTCPVSQESLGKLAGVLITVNPVDAKSPGTNIILTADL
ncbi:hypothetical protein GGQ84_000299 [Desulfitispora alkaliphila]|uniref:hypothetical protein n=1 Tax=Desulfitispora alkaliphila TaxID=622674 RepID=UPI003D1FA0FC